MIYFLSSNEFLDELLADDDIEEWEEELEIVLFDALFILEVV